MTDQNPNELLSVELADDGAIVVGPVVWRLLEITRTTGQFAVESRS